MQRMIKDVFLLAFLFGAVLQEVFFVALFVKGLLEVPTHPIPQPFVKRKHQRPRGRVAKMEASTGKGISIPCDKLESQVPCDIVADTGGT